ncbi:MAG: hypothetical protein AAGD43_02470 [Pseudomonadota bacterium]
MAANDIPEVVTDSGAGKAEARRLLIEPLLASGMRRAPKMTSSAYEAYLDKLAGYLGYMTRPNLEQLGDILLNCGGGKKRDEFPVWVIVRRMAHLLQTPPAQGRPLHWSFLHSAWGERARTAGYHVAAYWWIREKRIPPSTDFALAEIKKLQADFEEDRDPEHQEWLARLTQHVDQIVGAGIEHRNQPQSAKSGKTAA